MAFNLKRLFGKEESDDYVEIDLNAAEPSSEGKIMVKPYVLKQFDDVNDILGGLRDGYTIAVIDIRTLKSKDVVELKRAVAKIKKTIDAIEGSIAGFGENIIIATPKFAQIHKTAPAKPQKVDFIN